MPQASQLYGINICTTQGLLTATGAETVYDIAVAIAYSIDGKADLHATQVDGVTPTTDGNGDAFPALAVTNADGSISGKGACVVWCLNTSDAVECYQGDIVELDALTTDFLYAPPYPSIPDTATPFAYQILKQQTDGATADSATFGTSNWNATRFTNVIVDVFTLPRRPQES